MPVQRCQSMGRDGFKWGESGFCYTGDGARKKAERQGIAIKAGGYEEPLKDSDFIPPAAVRKNAEDGLELRKEFKRGGLSSQQAGEAGVGSGVVRATNLKNGERLSENTIKRMVRYFDRHDSDKDAAGSDSRGYWGNYENPSAGFIAWLLWGGDEGRVWANSLLARIEKAERES